MAAGVVAVPEWARESLPEWVEEYVGRKALPDCETRDNPLAPECTGIDFYQGNHGILHCDETSDYLYGEYTPLEFSWPEGLLPEVERLAKELTAGAASDTEKVVALVHNVYKHLPHCNMPPLSSEYVGCGRALDEEALLKDSNAWCNEQARVFIRMAQSLGIPARLVFLFYSDGMRSHAIAEAYADGGWIMSDLTYASVFPGADGKLMSARELHATPENRRRAGEVLGQRMAWLKSLPEEDLFGRRLARLGRSDVCKEDMEKGINMFRKAEFSKDTDFFTNNFSRFAIVNHPLPR